MTTLGTVRVSRRQVVVVIERLHLVVDQVREVLKLPAGEKRIPGRKVDCDRDHDQRYHASQEISGPRHVRIAGPLHDAVKGAFVRPKRKRWKPTRPAHPLCGDPDAKNRPKAKSDRIDVFERPALEVDQEGK